MPIYEFECRECGSRFEMLRPLGDTGKDLNCPDCGAGRPAKVFSSFAAATTGGDESACPKGPSCEAGSRFG